MTPTALGLVVACGMLIAGGLAAAAMALLPAPVRLADALGRLSGIASVDDPVVAGELGTDRLGAWAYRTLRLPLSAGQRRALHLRGMSISAFYAEKVVWFLIGLVTPGVVTTLLTVLVGLPWQVPLAVSLASHPYHVPRRRTRGIPRRSSRGLVRSLGAGGVGGGGVQEG